MSTGPLIIRESYRYPTAFNDQQQQQQLQLLQYSNAYFNPYEVKHRKRTSRAQLTVLEATFSETQKPSSAVKKALAAQLDMPLRNVQVWFQNRRAKDKHLASKAKAKAEKEGTAEEEADGDDADRSPSDGEEAVVQTTLIPGSMSAPAIGPSVSPTDHLLPPVPGGGNLSLRRGSAPSLGGPPPSLPARFSPRHSPLGNNNRAVSDTLRHTQAVVSESNDALEVPTAAMLGRRRSLPAFHPDHQQHFGHNSSLVHLNSLPTISDFGPSCEDDVGDPHTPPAYMQQFSLPSSQPGHGGAYRSSTNPKYGAAPYPLRGPMSYSYRSGSMPGTGVFRIPANPSSTLPTPWLTSNTNNNRSHGDEGVVTAESIFNQEGQPWAFPPRRMSDVASNPGPLPRADFSFGSHEDGMANGGGGGGFSSSPSYEELAAEEEEADAAHMARFGVRQTRRFGSFASDYSVESDATGTTATTATSAGFSPLTNGPLSAQSASHTRAARLGIMQSFGQYNYDATGAPISYGQEGSMAALSAGPVSFPLGFDPDMRRASCPAHFVDQFASFNVEGAGRQQQQQQQPTLPSALNTTNPLLPNHGIRQSPSSYVVGKSPLGISIQVPQQAQQRQALGSGDQVDSEPLTAIVNEYVNGVSEYVSRYGMPNQNGSSPPGAAAGAMGSHSSSSGTAATSRQTTQSPSATNGYSFGQVDQHQGIHLAHSPSVSPPGNHTGSFGLQQQNGGYGASPDLSSPSTTNGGSPYGQAMSSSLSGWAHPASGSQTHLGLGNGNGVHQDRQYASNDNSNNGNAFGLSPVYGRGNNGSTGSFPSYEIGTVAGGTGGLDGGYRFDPIPPQQQQQRPQHVYDQQQSLDSLTTQSMNFSGTSFLHAPAPLLPSSASSSLAGALSNNTGSNAVRQW